MKATWRQMLIYRSNKKQSREFKGEKEMTKNKTKKYEVTIIEEPTGVLDSDIFRMMVSKGDITSTPVTELVDEKLTINGTCYVKVVTDEKEFNLEYFNTVEKGIVHCGCDTLFTESYSDYSEYTDTFIVKKVKCKMGSAYKAVPVMEKIPTTDTEAVPFN